MTNTKYLHSDTLPHTTTTTRGATAAVVVYDITKAHSFKGAQSWVKELERRGDDNVVIALGK